MIRFDGSGSVFKIVEGSNLEDVTKDGWVLVAVIGCTSLMPITQISCPGGKSDGNGYQTTCEHGAYHGACYNNIEISQTPWGDAKYLMSMPEVSHIAEMKAERDVAIAKRKEAEAISLEAEKGQVNLADQLERSRASTKEERERVKTLTDKERVLEEHLGKARKHFGEKAFKEAIGA